MKKVVTFFLTIFSIYAIGENVGGLKVDYASFLSRNDIVYHSPALNGYDGLPLGNGKFGAVAWQPGELCFHFNSALSGPFGRSLGQLRLGTSPHLSSEAKQYEQRLSLYNATLNTDINYENGSFKSKVFIPAYEDAMIIQVENNRKASSSMIILEIWRKSAKFARDKNIIVLTDMMKRSKTFNYAMALTVIGPGVLPAGMNVLRTKAQKYTIYVTYAQSFGKKTEVAKLAKEKLHKLLNTSFDEIYRKHSEWWQNFWNKSLICLNSKNRVANYVENLWYIHLYAMAAGSRGEYPPKFNGGLWTWDRDLREWGPGYWHWNTQETYWPVFAANHLELHKPYQNLYYGILPLVKKATKRLWKTEGAQFHETLCFDGTIYSWKPVKGLHPRIPQPDKRNVTNMIFSSSAEIAMQFWWFYLYTKNKKFLREKAYPLIKNVIIFYLNYLEKDKNGIYNMFPSSAHESYSMVKNPINDVAALKYIFPVFIEASKLVNEDPELRQQCEEVLAHLPPYPIDPATKGFAAYEEDPNVKVIKRGVKDYIRYFPIAPFPNTLSGKKDHQTAVNSYRHPHPYVCGWWMEPIACARLQIADDDDSKSLYPGWSTKEKGGLGMERMLPLHIKKYQIFPNGLMDYSSRVYNKTHCYLESSGIHATAVNEMLLQSWDGIIQVFPALPKSWDAQFTLLAMGGNLVSASSMKGQVQFVWIKSQLGGEVKLKNPFNGNTIIKSGNKIIKECKDKIIQLPSQKDQIYVILAKRNPDAFKNRPLIIGIPNKKIKSLGNRKIGKK